MRNVLALIAFAAIVTSCSGYGGGGSPKGSAYPEAPVAPSAKPVSSPLPPGSPGMDDYGGY